MMRIRYLSASNFQIIGIALLKQNLSLVTNMVMLSRLSDRNVAVAVVDVLFVVVDDARSFPLFPPGGGVLDVCTLDCDRFLRFGDGVFPSSGPGTSCFFALRLCLRSLVIDRLFALRNSARAACR